MSLGLAAPNLYEGLELIDDKILEEDRVRKSEYSSGKPDPTEEVGESERDVEASAEGIDETSVEQPVDTPGYEKQESRASSVSFHA